MLLCKLYICWPNLYLKLSAVLFTKNVSADWCFNKSVMFLRHDPKDYLNHSFKLYTIETTTKKIYKDFCLHRGGQLPTSSKFLKFVIFSIVLRVQIFSEDIQLFSLLAVLLWNINGGCYINKERWSFYPTVLMQIISNWNRRDEYFRWKKTQ